jgi:hypothetical protein
LGLSPAYRLSYGRCRFGDVRNPSEFSISAAG